MDNIRNLGDELIAVIYFLVMQPEVVTFLYCLYETGIWVLLSDTRTQKSPDKNKQNKTNHCQQINLSVMQVYNRTSGSFRLPYFTLSPSLSSKYEG